LDGRARRLPNLRPSTASISLRMLGSLLGVPYQSLIKIWLAEKLDQG
jgi:hypothetical protein